MKDKKKAELIWSKAGFPNQLETDEVKATDAFGYQMAKAIEMENFYRPTGGGICSYYSTREKYHQLRLYARGEQSTKIYKDLITDGSDSSYTNYDWRPIQVIPKFLNLIVNQMSERLFSLKAEATDRYSTDLKDDYQRMLEDFNYSKPSLMKAKEVLGVDLLPEDADEYPQSKEEIDLHMQLTYKSAMEIACEKALTYTLDLNDYEETQMEVLKDITTIGIACVKHGTDINKGITIEHIDPANMVFAYPRKSNFKGVHYYGEIRRITISELKRLSNGKISDEKLRELAGNSGAWGRYHGFNSNEYDYNEDSFASAMVDVLFFNFKSVNTISYKKKYNKSGGFKMTKKDSDFEKGNEEDTGYDVVKKIIDVWYEGALVLGSDVMFNYKLCENMIRPKGNLNITRPNYIMYAPEIYQGRTRSFVQRIVPYVDQMQQIHIKIQQMIAKAKPAGIYIEVDGLEEISLGEGAFLTPLENIKMYNESGNVFGTGTDASGEYNRGRNPIVELKGGVTQGLDKLIASYNHYQGLVGDAIGISKGVDASSPNPDLLVGVQEQMALDKNTATRHILNSVLSITKSLGSSLLLRISDIFEYSDLREVYINALGKLDVEVLRALRNFHLHDLGLLIQLRPDTQDKQFLEQNISIALKEKSITLDDAIDVRGISTVKQANELLKVRRKRREKALNAHELQKIKAAGDAQNSTVQTASQVKLAEIEAKSVADLKLVEAKTVGKMKELVKEGDVKSGLMEEEFNYNVELNGMTVGASLNTKKMDNDRKDSSQKKAEDHKEKMLNKKAGIKKFESTNDNMGGSMNMGQHAPH